MIKRFQTLAFNFILRRYSPEGQEELLQDLLEVPRGLLRVRPRGVLQRGGVLQEEILPRDV